MESVIDNKDASRFELEVDGGVAIAEYRREGDTIVFTHTEVPRELRGNGVASRLIEGAFAHVRARGMRALPMCAFVRAYMDAHPETQNLAAER